MRNFSIDIVWAKIQMAVAAIGGWLGYFLGGMDGLMIALIVFMALDYITGLMCAVIDKKLSSAVGFKGICKKVLILMLVGVANVVDIHIVGTGSALRSAVPSCMGARKRTIPTRATANNRRLLNLGGFYGRKKKYAVHRRAFRRMVREDGGAALLVRRRCVQMHPEPA